MQNLSTIRQWQIGQLKNAINTLRLIVNNITNEDAKKYRDGGDGWTVLEVMGHLCDAETLFLKRAQLTLSEESPNLPLANANQQVIDKKYNENSLHDLLEIWEPLRHQFIELLEGVKEDQWERAGNHPARGTFTLNDQLFLATWHDINHMEQIAHILFDKK